MAPSDVLKFDDAALGELAQELGVDRSEAMSAFWPVYSRPAVKGA